MRIDALTSQLYTQALLRPRNAGMARAMQRLSTGLRINSAVDDPSGTGYSNNIKSVIGRTSTAIDNIQLGLNYLHTMDSALDEIQDLLHRGRDIAVRAANEAVNTNEDLQRMQNEVDGILASIDKIAESTTFNGKELLTGGRGQNFAITTQADWEAGTQFAPAGPNRLDTKTDPDSLKLELQPWTDDVTKTTDIGDQGEEHVCLYISSYADNGDGTADVEVRLSVEGGNAKKGYIQLDPSITPTGLTSLNGSTVNYMGGGLYDFSDTSGGQLNSAAAHADAVSIQFTIDKRAEYMDWSCTLTDPSNVQTAFYFGTNEMRRGLPSYTVGDYFTDIYNNVTWRSASIDTGQDAGGQAILTWDSTTSGGTMVDVTMYQSPDGAAWTVLPKLENGDQFEFTERYLMAEADLSSAGVAFGSPMLNSIDVKLVQADPVQAGARSDNDNQILMDIVDARTNALRVQDIDVTSLRKTMKLYDSLTEWQSGIASSDHIDILSDGGYVQITSPISNTKSYTPVAQVGGRNMYFVISQATQNANGTFDVTMSMTCYGQNAPPGGGTAMGWIGYLSVSDGDGAVSFDSVRNISSEISANWIPPPVGDTPPTWPIPNGYTSASATVDVNWVDDNAIAGAGPDRWVGPAVFGGSPDDTTITGSFQTIYFDYGTTGAQDGVEFTFTCDPDATISVSFEARGHTATHGDPGPAARPDVDIYFQDQLVCDDVGGGNGLFSFIRRLAEYGTEPSPGPNIDPPTGEFTTRAFYFGENASGNLEDIGANDLASDAQFEVWESPDGSGGWTKILDKGAGTSFTTSAGNDYIRIVGALEGTAASWTTASDPSDYSESTSPAIDSLRVTKNVTPIDEFQSGIERVSEIRAQIAVRERQLQNAMEELTTEHLSLTSMNMRVSDADYIQEISELAKNNILANVSLSTISNITDLRAQRVGYLLDGI